MRKARSQSLSAIAAFMAASLAWGQEAESGDRDFQEAARDAWIDGRLEGAYIFNEHLSAAAINTDVRNGVVTLTGTVDSDIDRDLAAQIAEGLKGVSRVDNRLRVAGEDRDVDADDRPAGAVSTREDDGRARVGSAIDGDLDADAEERRTFGQWVNDATTSAAVKSALIGNENIRARDIDVDVVDDVVTLRGVVASEQQKELAAELAENTRDVRQVRNELRVDAN
jgi:osmotically-inducible protein OsmY